MRKKPEEGALHTFLFSTFMKIICSQLLQRSAKCHSGSQHSVVCFFFFFTHFPVSFQCISLIELQFLLLLTTQFFFSFFFFQTNDCLLQNVKFIANPAPSSFIRTFTLERHTSLNVWTSKCTAEATVDGQINVALCTTCL